MTMKSSSSSSSSVIKLGPPIAALLVATGFQRFADDLPNGRRLPNPYPQGGVWAGVGHFKAGGGGALNPFGQDFSEAGFRWTESLCEMDSDGDGRTNGVELGDPDCGWFQGGPDPAEPALSHPGLEDQPQEKPVQTSCANYQEPDDAIVYDIQFTQPVAINSSRTHYICQQMELPVPQATKLHKIKSSVLLSNNSILHHMFISICWNGFSINDGNRVGEAPYQCSGAESSCTQLANWAVGPHDECLPSNIGEEFDFTGKDNVVVKIEAHYDNNLGTPVQDDKAGIRITFTPQLRPLAAGKSVWGMDVINRDFVIPPQQERYALTSICPTEATAAALQAPIYVFQFYPHMHLHGRTMFTEHYRCGKKIGEFGRIEPYEFDNQQQFRLSQPAKVLPGDALVTTCQFNTMDRNTSLESGLSTEDEMCASFMSFYPSLAEEATLKACFSFENGVAMERVNMQGGGGAMDVGAGVQDPAALAAIVQGRWALMSSNPGVGILTNFSSDPTASWAPCCETDSCDAAFLATTGGPCAADADCLEGLVCNGGLCAGGAGTGTAASSACGPTAPKYVAAVFMAMVFALLVADL